MVAPGQHFTADPERDRLLHADAVEEDRVDQIDRRLGGVGQASQQRAEEGPRGVCPAVPENGRHGSPPIHGDAGPQPAGVPTTFSQVIAFVADLRGRADLLSEAGLHRQRVAALRLAWDIEHEGYKP